MKKVALLFFTIILFNQLQSQICLGEDTVICIGQSVTISAICSGNGSPVYLLDSMQQVTLSDDQYSGVINIGFPFTFYGVVYNQLLISSNNYVSFDISQANGYSPWSINASAPNTTLPLNIVMGPYQDINPGLGGTIEYGIYGTIPNRRFVVRYNQVPMFSCTQDLFCSTMMLYEGTNHIELYIDNKPLCPTWNNGVAIEGVQDLTGSLASIVPGRNYPTQWTAFADGVQIYPANPTNYSITSITYVPSLLESGIQWFDTDGNFLGTGFEIIVSPSNDTTGYYPIYDQCYITSGGQGNTDTSWVYTDYPLVTAFGSSLNCIDTTGTVSAIATGIAPFTYFWDDPQGQTTSVATGLSKGTYTVTVVDSNGCINQAIAIVDSTVYTLNTYGSNALCYGDSSGQAYVDVSPLDSFVTYMWDANAGNQITDTAYNLFAGTYQVVITDSIGCKDSAFITIAEPTNFSIINNITNPSCSGATDGSIVVNVSGATPSFNYSWGTNQLTGLSSGSYSLVVTDSNNCVYMDTFILIDPPTISLILDTVSASCGLNDGMVTVTVQGGTPNYNYFWTPGGLGSDSLFNASTGLYSLMVTDANGCTASDSIIVSEYKGYNVDFSLSQEQGITPLTVQFTNNSFNCVTYFWDFGNGNTTTSLNPFDEIYTQEGEYIVSLIGCNSSGLNRCCDTIIKTVKVEDNSHCYWTNVFTPNGDSRNDEFEINCEKIKEFNIMIFNRWGTKVFESNNIDQSWDGTRNGNEVPVGTYFFVISATGVDGLEWNHKGTINLIR